MLDFGKRPEEETELNTDEKADDALENYEALFERFYGTDIVPGNRTELYAIYGRAPKEEKHEEFQKCKMTTVKGLPGQWNNGSGKLHVATYVEPYLKEALRRADLLGQLKGVERIGSYNHRHIRHDPNMPLSYHSWGAAVDIDPTKNSSKYRAKNWDAKMKRGPVPPPFSKQWQELWPTGVSYSIVRIFKACGFTWGGDWGKDDWDVFIQSHGVGYDASKIVGTFTEESWNNVSYIDPMHFELIGR